MRLNGIKGGAAAVGIMMLLGGCTVSGGETAGSGVRDSLRIMEADEISASEISESYMKPEVTPDATTAKEAVALTAARLVSALDEEITSLERTDADSWWDMDFATAGYSFPSTREIETDGVTKLSSEEEFSAYIKEYCDIWSSAEDTWTVEADEFCFRHDIQSVQWYADGEEIITYFAMDCAELDPQQKVEIEGEKTLYREETKSLYLFLNYPYTYREYLLSNQQLAATIEEQAVSGRFLFAVKGNPQEYSVAELVVVLPAE